MRRSVILLSTVLLAWPAAAQDDWGEALPCDGVLADAGQMAEILPQVPKYQSTYVLVFRNEHAEDVLALDSPALRDLRLAYFEESAAAELFGEVGLSNAQGRPFDPAGAGKVVEDVLAGEVDVGLLWAPLAGLAAMELDFNYDLSFVTASDPRPAPAAWVSPPSIPPGGRAATARAAEASDCAVEIDALLGGYGVVPAEKLVKVDIRSLLLLKPPPRDVAEARQGSVLYEKNCAKCHGPNAVAAQDALAPVDLLVSTPRFSFPGFLYIVWNGRSQNGMPRFRGTLEQEDIQHIYQFARERAFGTADLSSN